jgi:hypothetical protein
MKTGHRHDLKKNDLAAKLSDLQEFMGPRSKTLGLVLIGVLVVAVDDTEPASGAYHEFSVRR